MTASLEKENSVWYAKYLTQIIYMNVYKCLPKKNLEVISKNLRL